jgi:membrane dipeptidase
LSSFGKELIIEMNKVGIMVDISHVSDEAFFQAIEISEVPVIASHSSLRYFTPDFERNMSDAMLIKLAEKGGVVQINFGSTFILGKARDYSNEMKAYLIEELGEGFLSYSIEDQNEVRKKFIELKGPPPFAEVSDVLDHIDRAIKLVGVDHVGLGSDFDGVGDSLPVGLKDVSMYPNLIQGMLDRGYLEKDIGKILGGNIKRVWRSAEEYAKNAG